MNSRLTRKAFLIRGSLTAAAAMALPRLLAQSPPPSATAGAAASIPDRGPQVQATVIKQFVIAGHAQLDAVKEMLGKQPALINATWDWGGGDFETALGGASHMGRPDIAEVLLAHGARLDLFAAAMLGKIEIVKTTVAAFPDIVKVPGPHNIPLLAHTEKGGTAAAAVVEFLRPLVTEK